MRAAEEADKARSVWAKLAMYKKQRTDLESEIAQVAQEALDTVEEHALPHASSDSAKRRLEMLRGEYLMALAETATGPKRKQLGTLALIVFLFSIFRFLMDVCTFWVSKKAKEQSKASR